MASKIKILVTGSSGFIGSNLMPVLKKKHIVLGFDLKNRESIFDPSIESAIRSCNVVIHLAAITSVNQSFNRPDTVYKVNTLGTARIAELCLRYKKKLIYPSSAAIYHPDLSPYANSKYLAELLLIPLKDIIPAVILRFYNVFGPGMNPDSGSVMYNFLTSKKLVIYGDGEQTRDFIHVQDVVRIIEDAIKPEWNGQIVDVGTGQAYSMNYIANLFAHYQKRQIEYEPPRREIRWSIAKIDQLKKLYKKPLFTNLEEDVEELCQKYR